jgi:signal transduction histidine kinase
MFTATLIFRVGIVAGIAATAGSRHSLPDWMIGSFLLIAAPLFIYNMVAFLWRKRLESILTQYPWLLMMDLLIAVTILSLGGGWRNSYFMYTLTTIILFTIFLKRQGAWSAAAMCIGAALLKEPGGELPAVATFGVTNWDMRLGAALFYLCAGLILGYFDTLLSRIERLAQMQVIATQQRVAMEEKARLALGLHDGAKQMITALLLRSRGLLRRQEWEETAVRQELEWLWRGMSYLQTELTQLVNTLQGQEQAASFELAAIAREEIQLVEALTGCCWTLVTSEEEKTSLSLRQRDGLRPFLSEALMNTWKHSGVAAGTVELKRRHGEVIVIIADRGRGFDPPASASQATLGLQSLRRRARELGGRLELVSRPGEGCRLTLTFPAHLPDG